MLEPGAVAQARQCDAVGDVRGVFRGLLHAAGTKYHDRLRAAAGGRRQWRRHRFERRHQQPGAGIAAKTSRAARPALRMARPVRGRLAQQESCKDQQEQAHWRQQDDVREGGEEGNGRHGQHLRQGRAARSRQCVSAVMHINETLMFTQTSGTIAVLHKETRMAKKMRKILCAARPGGRADGRSGVHQPVAGQTGSQRAGHTHALDAAGITHYQHRHSQLRRQRRRRAHSRFPGRSGSQARRRWRLVRDLFCEDRAMQAKGSGDSLIGSNAPARPTASRWPSRAVPASDVAQMPSRVVALSDIEGNLAYLEGALRKLELVDKDGNWAFGANRLVPVGDSVDRGRDVFGVLWRLHGLALQAEAAGGRAAHGDR